MSHRQQIIHGSAATARQSAESWAKAFQGEPVYVYRATLVGTCTAPCAPAEWVDAEGSGEASSGEGDK